jgi:hypothetical protein
VCCRFSWGAKCTGVNGCAESDLLCDPQGPSSQCAPNKACDIPLDVGGTTLPYFLCAP